MVRIGGMTSVASALCGWDGGMLVLLVMSCRVPSKIYTGFTLSADTVTCLPRTIISNDLSVRDAECWVQGTAYGVLP